MSARFQFRCVAVTERLLGVKASEWEVTFAPLIRPNGEENLEGRYGAFSVLIHREREAAAFKVGEMYDFEVRSTPERQVYPE